MGAEEQDLLVIGVGYDDELIRRIAESKRVARKLRMFGLPSLRPTCTRKAGSELREPKRRLAHFRADQSSSHLAKDPCATAQELHDQVSGQVGNDGPNLYLRFLSTKAQALGFAIFHLCECAGGATSMILPFAEFYWPETSVGLSRVSLDHLELDWFVTRHRETIGQRRQPIASGERIFLRFLDPRTIFLSPCMSPDIFIRNSHIGGE